MSASPVSPEGRESGPAFSLLDKEPPLRWSRLLRLVPASGLGVGRRALFFVLLTWLPIVAWAFATRRLAAVGVGEPLLQHFGVHVGWRQSDC